MGEENLDVTHEESGILDPHICRVPLKAGKELPDFLSPINHMENSKSLMSPRGKLSVFAVGSLRLQRKNKKYQDSPGMMSNAIMYGKRTLSVNPKAVFKYLSVTGCYIGSFN